MVNNIPRGSSYELTIPLFEANVAFPVDTATEIKATASVDNTLRRYSFTALAGYPGKLVNSTSPGETLATNEIKLYMEGTETAYLKAGILSVCIEVTFANANFPSGKEIKKFTVTPAIVVETCNL